MATSSSSDDGDSSSDDELLLASPIFKSTRRAAVVDRGAARIEKNKLDFLQTCLQGSDARTDIQRRLNEIDEEFGLRVSDSLATAVTSSEGEKQHQQEEGDGEADEGVSMNENSGKSTPLAEKNITKVGTCNNGSTSSSKESNVQSQQEHPTSYTEFVTKKKQEEEAYWARINSFVEANAATSTNKKTSTATSTHSARRKLDDAISGLTGYASSEGGGDDNDNDDITDDEGGRWRDGYCGMTRERLRSEAEAKSRGSSSHIGLRKMLYSSSPPSLLSTTPHDVSSTTTTTTTGKMDNFQTRQEAYNELKSIIVTLHNTHCTPQTPSEKVFAVVS